MYICIYVNVKSKLPGYSLSCRSVAGWLIPTSIIRVRQAPGSLDRVRFCTWLVSRTFTRTLPVSFRPSLPFFSSFSSPLSIFHLLSSLKPVTQPHFSVPTFISPPSNRHTNHLHNPKLTMQDLARHPHPFPQGHLIPWMHPKNRRNSHLTLLPLMPLPLLFPSH